MAWACVVMQAMTAVGSDGEAAVDPQRPVVSYTPPRGWMNDPSKPLEDNRPCAAHRFHLFFQWTPNSTKASWEGGWGPFWGHAVADTVAGPWSTFATPINIGRQGTGGCVRYNATHYALTWPGGAALSADPELHQWTAYRQTQQNATQPFGMQNGNNNAVWHTGSNFSGQIEMAVSGAVGSVGDRRTDPILLRFATTTIVNNTQWTYKQPIWIGKGLRQGRAECGDYFQLDNRHVAMYSHSGAVVVWMLGDELANGTFVEKAIGQADYGSYYASASLKTSAGQRVIFAWVPEARPPPYGGSIWASVQALPREIVLLNNQKLAFIPSRDLERWRGSPFPIVTNAVVNGTNFPLSHIAGAALELHVSMYLAPGAPVTASGVYRPGVLVRCGGTNVTAPAEWTFVGLNIPHGDEGAMVLIDRKASSITHGPYKNWQGIPDEPLPSSGVYTFRIFVDHSVITVFAPSGRVLTSRIYPALASSVGVQLVSAAAATHFNITAWPLARQR